MNITIWCFLLTVSVLKVSVGAEILFHSHTNCKSTTPGGCNLHKFGQAFADEDSDATGGALPSVDKRRNHEHIEVLHFFQLIWAQVSKRLKEHREGEPCSQQLMQHSEVQKTATIAAHEKDRCIKGAKMRRSLGQRQKHTERFKDIEVSTKGGLTYTNQHMSLFHFELLMLLILGVALPVVYWRKIRIRHLYSICSNTLYFQ
ncbi:hypothetical protein CEUSTIGMA_g500.t1 [Chlamydomonas eustigma]|uniref:Uncharacterized protein n=1 Tax=Chlamydomonas eustigma TaxID=1157962 RepID=A0A250WQC7_9CHLO|nr:hypothetical protein CEUSTIGMA_g500.t1 [Chlamydomonas eustigma]|eukprot:GAX73047.1 hypothetical protein CEUSTIGMA_g500.t1 [Chlamydomonas eustigma]